MLDETATRGDLVVRKASAEDYGAFSRLFPELLVDDPVPSAAVWASLLLPTTWVAVRDEQVVGYCYFQEYEETGYVRNIVVAPAARGSGVGRALMQATAAYLRSRHKTSWRLNVKPDNRAALALYERMGMRTKYLAKLFRLPWVALKVLSAGSVAARALTADRDHALETLFELPRGQLAAARGVGRVLLEAVAPGEARSVKLAVFDPKFPGAFPFRIQQREALPALLVAMRAHVPTDEYVKLVVEDDARLAELLESMGATLGGEFVHMEAPL